MLDGGKLLNKGARLLLPAVEPINPCVGLTPAPSSLICSQTYSRPSPLASEPEPVSSKGVRAGIVYGPVQIVASTTGGVLLVEEFVEQVPLELM